MTSDLKQRLVNHLKQIGAYDVRIADPQVRYEHALPGQHPMELWPQCKSVIVFAVACAARTNNIYIGPYAPWQGERDIGGPIPKFTQSEDYGMERLARLIVSNITLKTIPRKFSEIIVRFTFPRSFAVSVIDECEKFLLLNDSST